MSSDEPEGYGRKRIFRLDLQDRDIGFGIRADNFRAELGAVGKVDRDLVRALDHVVVGDDDAVLAIEHEARSKRLNAARTIIVTVLTVEELVEKFLKRRAFGNLGDRDRALGLDVLGGGDVHHRVEKRLCQIRNGFRRLRESRGGWHEQASGAEDAGQGAGGGQSGHADEAATFRKSGLQQGHWPLSSSLMDGPPSVSVRCSSLMPKARVEKQLLRPGCRCSVSRV